MKDLAFPQMISAIWEEEMNGVGGQMFGSLTLKVQQLNTTVKELMSLNGAPTGLRTIVMAAMEEQPMFGKKSGNTTGLIAVEWYASQDMTIQTMPPNIGSQIPMILKQPLYGTITPTQVKSNYGSPPT